MQGSHGIADIVNPLPSPTPCAPHQPAICHYLAGPHPENRRPAILWTAIYSGSLELVRLVLEAYPGRPREWCRGEGGLRAVEVALQCLVTELERPVAAGLAPVSEIGC